MGVSSHELYMILKVRDEGSRVLRGFAGTLGSLDRQAMIAAQRQMVAGAALATLGVGLAAAGAAGISFFNEAVNASMAYTQEAAKTLTQVDKLGVSLEDVKDMGRRVAMEVPIAFEAIQAGLYDIFSSMDVTMPGAEALLISLSKAAVGGSVDVSTAARATIGLLNAYKLPASEVNNVNDVMFQLVRKGIGTYEQFTSTIGRAIPSAVKAGQTYQSVAGMMAFLTRNNMSTAMSASSVARAMDAISRTKSIDRLKEMGVAVVDAKGKFRPMVTIMTELREKLKNLSPAAKAAKLEEIFKGSGGTIQAMRFFNLATGKAGPLLNTMTTAMQNAKGAANDAYKIMSNTPLAKIQALNNRYQVMKTTIGDQLLPVKMALVEALSKLLGWWEKLDSGTKKNIVIFLAVASAVMVVVGVILIITGAILMFTAAAAMAGIALLPLIGAVAAVILILGLLAFGVYYVITHWEDLKRETIFIWEAIKGFLSRTWDWIKEKALMIFNSVKDWFSRTWNDIKNKVLDVWNTVKNWLSTTWNSIKNSAVGIFNSVKDWFSRTWNDIKTNTTNVWDGIKGWLSTTWNDIKDNVVSVWNTITEFISGVWKSITDKVSEGIAWVSGEIAKGMERARNVWQAVWGLFGPLVTAVWDLIMSIVELGITLVGALISTGMRHVSNGWNIVWNGISTFVRTIWEIIYAYVSGKVTELKNWFTGSMDAISTKNTETWNAVSAYVTRIWNAIYDFVAPKITAIKTWLATKWDEISAKVTEVWNAISGWVSTKWNQISTTVTTKVNAVKATLSTKWNEIKAETVAGWNALTKNISDQWNKITADVDSKVKTVKRYVSDGWNNLVLITKTLWTEFKRLITEKINLAMADVGAIKNRVTTFFLTAKQWLIDAGMNILRGLIKGLTDMINDLTTKIKSITAAIKAGVLGDLLVQKGKDIIAGLISGIQAAPGKVLEAITSVGSSIIKGVKTFFGIESPSRVMAGLGAQIIRGLIVGIVKNRGQVPQLLKSVFGDVKSGLGGALGWLQSQGEGLVSKVLGGAGNLGKAFGDLFSGGDIAGSGANRWIPVIQQALTMLGESLSNVPTVLRLINKESGGNPRAINNWDINAKNGTPSMGLIQTILPTFNAFAGTLKSLGPMNPLANIYAGLNYARSRYGSIRAVDPLIHAGGYALGTINALPGYAWVGERGPELLKFRGGEQVVPNSAIGNSQGKTITVTQHINTQEINPVKHAADLGWEVARAM